MKLLVYLRDGRTVLALKGRGELGRLLKVEPWHEDRDVICVRGIWNSVTGAYIWTPGIRIRFIAKGSIAYVEDGVPS